jgi:hypothetical protein
MDGGVDAGLVAANLSAGQCAWVARRRQSRGRNPIDFDARTRHLDNYAFLAEADCRLGITGATGVPMAQLDALAGTVDEIVLQIYQGAAVMRPIFPGLRMKRRSGLLQGGEWHSPPGLDSNPNFRGYVVFLQNGATQ